MKRQRLCLSLAFLIVMTGVVFSFNQPLLIIKENAETDGTHLELYEPTIGKTINLTDATTPGLYNLSFPVVCEQTGLIGFTNHTRSMEAEVYLIDPDSREPKKVLDKAVLEDISFDGKQLLLSGASSTPSLYVMDIATRQIKQITQGYTVSSARFSPDGQTIVFAVMDKTGSMDIYSLDRLTQEILPLVQTTQWSEYYPSFTRDGRYVLFMTNRTGLWGVDYLDMQTGKRYQADLWGMYPTLSDDDAWTALEKDGQILVSKTSGKELQILSKGSTPQWISLSAAARFLDHSTVQSSTPENRGDLLTSASIGPEGGDIAIPGRISLHIPGGILAAASGNKRLSVYEASIEGAQGKLFDLEWEGAPTLFSQFVDITVPLEAGENPDDYMAIDEISEGIWMRVPSDYDKTNHAITFQTAHFSKKGIISEIGPKDVREFISGAVGSIGTGIGFIVIVGSAKITLPALGIMALGGYLISKTGIADPVVDKGFELYHGLNRTYVLDEGIRISWVEDASSVSNMPGDKILMCVERGTNKILFGLYDQGTDAQKRAAAVAASLNPLSGYALVNIPVRVLQVAAELKWIKNYYKENGYSVPQETDVWVYKIDTSGGWNGTKLEIDVDYFADQTEKTRAGRMVVLAHEYWHSVYQYNGYSPQFKWLDECLASTFESQALPESKRWYTQTVLPRYEHFYDMYKGEQVAQTLRSGLVFEGTNGIDADRIKRGYHLWPWGKFLLATQSHEEIRLLLTNEMTAKNLSTYFSLFCKGILISDFEVDEGVPESVLFLGKTVDYESISAWSALQVKSFISSSILTPGSAKSNFSQGVYLKPIPLSMNILQVKTQLPNQPAPLIIRRANPDDREEWIAMHPQKASNAYGRQLYDDVLAADGILVVMPNWLNTTAKSVEIPIAIINSATEENWSEYFGYGENPIYTYFLKQPENPAIKEAEGKLVFTWENPDFGNGLTAGHCLSQYNLYVADKDLKTIHFLTSLTPQKRQTDIAYYQVAGYDQIGIASVDRYAKDTTGKPLVSTIAWISLQTGKGVWKKVAETYSYRFGNSYSSAVEGRKPSATHETGMNRYEIKMSSDSAKTMNTNLALYTGGSETASFSHSWSSLPEILTPGQTLSQTITVADNTSSGKNALDLRGSTEFQIYTANINHQVSAGGALWTKASSWKPQETKTFNWIVPKPTTLEMTQPKQNRLKIFIICQSQSNETTTGYYTVEYEYQP